MSAGVRSWRLLAGSAALAAAARLIAAAPPPPAPDLATLLPPTTLAYARLTDPAGMGRRFEASALDRFDAEGRPARAAEWRNVRTELMREIRSRYVLELEPLLHEATAVSVALLDLRFSDGRCAPQLLAAIDTSSAATVKELIDKAGLAVEAEHGDVMIHHLELQGEDLPFAEIYLAGIGGRLLLGTSADLLEHALDRQGGSESGTSLAATPEFVAARAATPAGAALFLYADVPAALRSIQRDLTRSELRTYQQAEAFFGFHAVGRATGWAAWEGGRVRAGLRLPLTGSNDLYAVLRQPPASGRAFDVVPPDAWLAVATGLRDAPGTWTRLRHLIEEREECSEERAEERRFGAAVERFERQAGKTIQDLLQEAGNEAVVWARPREGNRFDDPETACAVRVRAAVPAREALEEALRNGGRRPSFLSKPYHEAEIRTQPSGLSLLALGDWLFVAEREEMLQAAVDAARDRHGLASRPEFADAVAGLPLPAPISGVLDLEPWLRHLCPPRDEDRAWWQDAGPVRVGFALEEGSEALTLSLGTGGERLVRLAAAALVSTVPSVAAARRRQESGTCAGQIGELAALLQEHRQRAGGGSGYPVSLDELRAAFNLDDAQFLCPVLRHLGGSEPPPEARYVYLYPLAEDRTPPGQVVLFESGANHEGRHAIARFDQSTGLVTDDQLKQTLGPQVTELLQQAAAERERLERLLQDQGSAPEGQEAAVRLLHLDEWVTDYTIIRGGLLAVPDAGLPPGAVDERALLARLRAAGAEIERTQARSPLALDTLARLRRRIAELEGRTK